MKEILVKRQINPGEREGEGRYKDKIWGGKGERPLSEGGVAGSLCSRCNSTMDGQCY